MRSRLLPILARLATAASLLLAAACDSGPPDGTWRKIERPGFSVDFLGKPEFKDDTVDAGEATLSMQEVEWNRGEEQFGVQVIDFTPASHSLTRSSTEILDDFVQGGTKSTGGTAISDRSLTVSGAPAREIVVNVPTPTSSQMISRIIWSSPHAYLVSYTRPTSIAESPDGRKFIESFQLTTH